MKEIKTNKGFTFVGLIVLLAVAISVGVGINAVIKNNAPKSEPAQTASNGAQAPAIITAKGSYTYQKYSVNLSINIPVAGGPITGSFSGPCGGDITGNYSANSGAITGEASGGCLLVMPVSAKFTGTVNKSNKIVYLNGTGIIAGKSGSGSINLNY